MENRKLIVIGGGPIGLEAALRAAIDGFDVTVLEKGRVGAAIRGWKHVRLFTPFHMNSSATGRKCIADSPDDSAILSGGEVLTRYLQPLADSEHLQGRVLEHHKLLAVSRTSYGKSDRIGSNNRSEKPFRLLVDTPHGEQLFESDVLLDCTGFTTKHRFIGAGGIPCPGESDLPDDAYRIPDVPGTDSPDYSDRHTLVVGSGYSAATTVCGLATLAESNPGTKITWITRGDHSAPIAAIPNDPLQDRISLAETANKLATGENTGVTWLPGPLIDSISRHDDGYLVELSIPNDADGQSRAQELRVDRIVGNAGFRPNTEPFNELQIHRCYATDGPIKLAAHLLGETSSDCMNQTSGGTDLLMNPEPNFYILGAASYGRDSRFLLQVGLQQIDDLFSHIKVHREAPA